MVLSYSDLSGKRHRTNATITTEHPASSHGKPVIVLEDGGVLYLMSWAAMSYQVEKATKEELAALEKMGI